MRPRGDMSLPRPILTVERRFGRQNVRSIIGRARLNTTRLTPLGRLVILVTILTLGAIAGAAGAAATKPHAQAWRCVAVRPGDTLWGLAGRAGSGDKREVVQRIVDHNRLGPGPVVVGMAIWVPNEAASGELLGADPALCPPAR